MMRLDELSKYYHIKLEIKQLEDNLKELDNTAIGSPILTGMPHSQGIVGNPTESLILKKDKLENLLKNKKEKLYDEQIKIEEFLEQVEDNTIRIIIRARFINCKSWKQIGKELNFDRTTPYYHLKKYLKSHNKEEAEKCQH